MIESKSASEIVNAHPGNFGVEKLPLENSLGKVLTEDIMADRDFPPFDRIMMDGIAISFSAWKNGSRSFKVEGVQCAGESIKTLNNSGNALEVMTGAILPVNTDTVIPYEEFTIADGVADVNAGLVKLGQHVHKQGIDKKELEVVIRKGTTISPSEVALLATVGKSEVLVKRMPRIAIISSGDELVEVNEKPELHQIRKSNVYALKASLQELGIESELHHIIDEPEMMKKKIGELLADNEALILSGGVSKGKKDYMPEVLESLGVNKLFHRVKQRPGKPFWFGTTKEGKCVFAFPGNPVSTYMCFYKYFIPWLAISTEAVLPNNMAKLTEDFEFNPSLTYFLQVATENINGEVLAKPIKGKGSGDLANLAEVDAFLELPEERKSFKAGEVFPLIRFRGSYSK